MKLFGKPTNLISFNEICKVRALNSSQVNKVRYPANIDIGT